MAVSRSQLQALYRRRAKRYDVTANLYYLIGFREHRVRRKAVNGLRLKPGDTVVEIGCGTGLNFALLHNQVGQDGRIIGVDMTPAMLAQARERAARHGWSNIDLVTCDAAEFEFPEVDGILSTFALTLVPEFDEVIRRGASRLSPGGRWAIADFRMPSGRTARLAPLLLPPTKPFGVSLDLAERHPWESLHRHLGNLEIESIYCGFVYVAVATKEN
ncbi:MAG: methyltransferase domain-containing protein [Gemmatimonadales bacterium]|nr:MAG: methyltransferase domain-containing protein [Gemmatimonadales bacterium]